MKNNVLNIFFVIDKNYIVPFTVTLTSILENNKDLELQVFIIHELDQNSQLDLSCNFFREKYSLNVNLIKFEDKYFNDFHTEHHITKATYFKLLLGEVIPETITEGLYIDCDTVVNGSLKGLCDLSFTSNSEGSEVSLLTVKDIKADREITRLKKLGINLTNYFNAGVLFINLRKWRAENMAQKMIEVGQKYNEHLTYLDQDIQNIFFRVDQGDLEDTYNKDASIKYTRIPLILHYLGNSKPWHFVDNGPYKHIYHNYLKMTPFKNLKTENITLKNVARKYVRLFRQKLNIQRS